MTIEGNSTDSYTSQYVEVNGSKIHYIEDGYGMPILFLHGIPTSSHVWRKIFSHLSMLGECIAPDLIGFGSSDKPDIAYTVQDHIGYINQFIEALDLKDVLIVMHGVGSVIGLDYALKHVKNCRGLVFYEAFIQPVVGDNMSLPYHEQVNLLSNATESYASSQEGIGIVDQMLLQSMIRKPSETVLASYRQPFLTAGSAQPVIQYIKEMPKGDGKSTIDLLLKMYLPMLIASKLPVLLLYSIPGFITTMSTVTWAKEHLPNVEVMDIGEELHLGQESNPSLLGESISIWLQGIELRVQETV